MFLPSKLTKIKFLVMKFLYVKQFFGSEIFWEFEKCLTRLVLFSDFFLSSDWSQYIVTYNLPSQIKASTHFFFTDTTAFKPQNQNVNSPYYFPYVFPVPVRRICSNAKTFYSWRSFTISSQAVCLILKIVIYI